MLIECRVVGATVNEIASRARPVGLFGRPPLADLRAVVLSLPRESAGAAEACFHGITGFDHCLGANQSDLATPRAFVPIRHDHRYRQIDFLALTMTEEAEGHRFHNS